MPTTLTKIVFIQNKCSDGRRLNIEKLILNNIENENTILLCNDENLYETSSSNHDIANLFVKSSLLTNYIETIKNASEIYIIDSAFTGIILPLLKTNKLKAKTVRIIKRDLTENILL